MTDQQERDPHDWVTGDATAGSGDAQHPDTRRDATVDEELAPATRSQMETLGRPPSDEDSAEAAGPGQNSDRLPQ